MDGLPMDRLPVDSPFIDGLAIDGLAIDMPAALGHAALPPQAPAVGSVAQPVGPGIPLLHG